MVVALAMVAAAVPLSSDALRHRIVQELSARMNADIELGDLDLRLFPRLQATGESLKVRQHGNGDEPIISVQRFVVDADLLGVVRKRVAHVQLHGLRIVIPPSRPEPETPVPVATSGGADTKARTDPSFARGVIVNALEADDAQLVTLPDANDAREGKRPRVWAIHKLTMREVGARSAMPFDATLTNAVPPGEIVTSGQFGPWHVDDPGATPLHGSFSFDHADLGVFHGVAGLLSSRGQFGGTLDFISAHGEADVPNFAITIGGQPFALHTKYDSVVDGTNGNTILKRIDASFLDSSLTASGSVYDAPGEPGRYVQLDVDMERARIEDVMKMAVKAPKPVMTGALRLKTKFLLPPGQSDVADRLHLDGQFAIAGARFTNVDVQSKIRALSAKSQGKDVEELHGRVLSNFEGRFTLANGRLKLPVLTFTVPGAEVELAGNYALKPQALDFKGTMLMDATISETQHGWKKLLLKVVDPLFRRKDGKDGSAIPFKIDGKRGDPKFGLDYGRVFKR
ncbi:MAG TPA: AsmA-like C-terminal region-containing protein [Vicinamibacterales bacterium]|nr:AsmA-like C-terminal region-containing protein [Vicinamibacterales bacterium]